jgi:hypothetical protein
MKCEKRKKFLFIVVRGEEAERKLLARATGAIEFPSYNFPHREGLDGWRVVLLAPATQIITQHYLRTRFGEFSAREEPFLCLQSGEARFNTLQIFAFRRLFLR